MDAVRLLGAGYDWTEDRVGRVRLVDLELATPCDRWDLRQLLNHMLGSTDLLAAAVAGAAAPTGGAAAVSQDLAGADRLGTDPAAAYRAVATWAKAAWGAPGALDRTCALPMGPAPASMVAGLALLEVVVHGWDISQATGEAAPVPDELAVPILAYARQHAETFGTAFAAPIPLAGPAAAGDEMVALLGRKPL